MSVEARMKENNLALHASMQQREEGKRERGIDRLIDILQVLVDIRSPVTAGQLAQLIGAPRSTTYEIVNRLIEAEIVAPISEDGRLHLGPMARLIGLAYTEGNPAYRRDSAALDSLVAEIGETVQICGIRKNKHVILDVRAGKSLFRLMPDLGAEVPLPWTASGRIFLGHMESQEIRSLVGKDDFNLPDGGILSMDTFLADIEQARLEGYCVTHGLVDRHATCLAVPIFGRGGIVRRTVCIVVPIDTAHDRIADYLNRLKARANYLAGFE
jgi:DNA-binding IclR family transcriptional regulator